MANVVVKTSFILLDKWPCHEKSSIIYEREIIK